MRHILALLCVTLLTACGAAGPPTPPGEEYDFDEGPSVGISGTASIGVGRTF